MSALHRLRTAVLLALLAALGPTTAAAQLRGAWEAQVVDDDYDGRVDLIVVE